MPYDGSGNAIFPVFQKKTIINFLLILFRGLKIFLYPRVKKEEVGRESFESPASEAIISLN